MASQKMLQTDKIASSNHDDGPLEPPPAYSATSDPGPSSLPSTYAPPGQSTKIQEALWTFQTRIHEAVTQNDLKGGIDEEEREVRKQLLHLMSDFLSKVSQDSPKSVKDLPASANRVLKADLYVAPQEEVPLSDGWHLSGASQRDDEIVGRAVQEGRVRPTGIEPQPAKQRKESEASGSGSQNRLARGTGLWSSADPLFSDNAGHEPRGALWWDDEREAQELAQTLELHLRLFPGASTLPGRDILQSDKNACAQMKIRAEYMTFRRENEMGLWESRSGWTIAMAVTLFY